MSEQDITISWFLYRVNIIVKNYSRKVFFLFYCCRRWTDICVYPHFFFLILFLSFPFFFLFSFLCFFPLKQTKHSTYIFFRFVKKDKQVITGLSLHQIRRIQWLYKLMASRKVKILNNRQNYYKRICLIPEY